MTSEYPLNQSDIQNQRSGLFTHGNDIYSHLNDRIAYAYFKEKNETLDWRNIRTLKFLPTGQENNPVYEDVLRNIISSQLDIDDLELFGDQRMIKVFLQDQLLMEYLLNSQEALLRENEELKMTSEKIQTEEDKEKRTLDNNFRKINDQKEKIKFAKSRNHDLNLQKKNLNVKKCPYCEKIFKSLEFLEQHIRNKHKAEIQLSVYKDDHISSLKNDLDRAENDKALLMRKQNDSKELGDQLMKQMNDKILDFESKRENEFQKYMQIMQSEMKTQNTDLNNSLSKPLNELVDTMNKQQENQKSQQWHPVTYVQQPEQKTEPNEFDFSNSIQHKTVTRTEEKQSHQNKAIVEEMSYQNPNQAQEDEQKRQLQLEKEKLEKEIELQREKEREREKERDREERERNEKEKRDKLDKAKREKELREKELKDKEEKKKKKKLKEEKKKKEEEKLDHEKNKLKEDLELEKDRFAISKEKKKKKKEKKKKKGSDDEEMSHIQSKQLKKEEEFEYKKTNRGENLDLKSNVIDDKTGEDMHLIRTKINKNLKKEHDLEFNDLQKESPEDLAIIYAKIKEKNKELNMKFNRKFDEHKKNYSRLILDKDMLEVSQVPPTMFRSRSKSQSKSNVHIDYSKNNKMSDVFEKKKLEVSHRIPHNQSQTQTHREVDRGRDPYGKRPSDNNSRLQSNKELKMPTIDEKSEYYQHDVVRHHDVNKTSGPQHRIPVDNRDPNHRDNQHRDPNHRDNQHRDPNHRDNQHRDPQQRDNQHRDPQQRDNQHRDPQQRDNQERQIQQRERKRERESREQLVNEKNKEIEPANPYARGGLSGISTVSEMEKTQKQSSHPVQSETNVKDQPTFGVAPTEKVLPKHLEKPSLEFEKNSARINSLIEDNINDSPPQNHKTDSKSIMQQYGLNPNRKDNQNSLVPSNIQAELEKQQRQTGEVDKQQKMSDEINKLKNIENKLDVNPFSNKNISTRNISANKSGDSNKSPQKPMSKAVVTDTIGNTFNDSKPVKLENLSLASKANLLGDDDLAEAPKNLMPQFNNNSSFNPFGSTSAIRGLGSTNPNAQRPNTGNVGANPFAKGGSNPMGFSQPPGMQLSFKNPGSTFSLSQKAVNVFDKKKEIDFGDTGNRNRDINKNQEQDDSDSFDVF